MMAARWSDSPQDNEESKHRAITPSCEVGPWREMCLSGPPECRSTFYKCACLCSSLFLFCWSVLVTLNCFIWLIWLILAIAMKQTWILKLFATIFDTMQALHYLTRVQNAWEFTCYNGHLDACEAPMKAIRLLRDCNFISGVSKVSSLSENSWHAVQVTKSVRERNQVSVS